MEDNPLNTSTKENKLPQVKRYEEAWLSLTDEDVSRSEFVWNLPGAPAWDLARGILSLCAGPRTIQFRQLPSSVRGIPERTWELDLDFDIVDFTIDPGQDLMVAIEVTSATECDISLSHFSTEDA